jgi:outer membrane protein with beta-barrel domain
MKRLIIVVLAIAALPAVTPALAGIGKHNGEIGFDFGYTDFDQDLSDSNGARFAIRGGYHFSDWFQLEAEDVGMATSASVGLLDTDTTIGAFFVNGVFNFHPGKGSVVPYVLGGVGLATIRIDYNLFGNADDTGGASQFAFGSRFFFGRNKRAAFRLEASLMRHKTSDLIITNQDFTEKSLTAGFTWRLGRQR